MDTVTEILKTFESMPITQQNIKRINDILKANSNKLLNLLGPKLPENYNPIIISNPFQVIDTSNNKVVTKQTFQQKI